MKITPNGMCSWVDTVDSCSYKDLIHASISLNEHLHPIPKLAKAIKTAMDYYGYVCFPMAIMDNKLQKIDLYSIKGGYMGTRIVFKKNGITYIASDVSPQVNETNVNEYNTFIKVIHKDLIVAKRNHDLILDLMDINPQLFTQSVDEQIDKKIYS